MFEHDVRSVSTDKGGRTKKNLMFIALDVDFYNTYLSICLVRIHIEAAIERFDFNSY